MSSWKTPRVRTVLVALIVLAALIVLNVLAVLLPGHLRAADVSRSRMFTLSAVSKQFLSELKQDVTLYFLCENGDPSAILTPFLDRYAAYPHVRVQVVDTTDEPSFYLQYTRQKLSNFSLIVESGKRSTSIDYGDMMHYYSEMLAGNQYLSSYANIPYGSFAQAIAYLGLMTGQDLTPYYTLYFDGDTVLTSAIEYVTAEFVPGLYLLGGHNEETIADEMKTLLDNYGVSLHELDLSQTDRVPNDCSLLFVQGPRSDLSDSELASLRAFLARGGNMILLSDGNVAQLGHFQALLSDFGLQAGAGVLWDRVETPAPQTEEDASADENAEEPKETGEESEPGTGEEPGETEPETVLIDTDSFVQQIPFDAGSRYAASIASFTHANNVPLTLSEPHPIYCTAKEGIVQEVLSTTSDRAYRTVGGTRQDETGPFTTGIIAVDETSSARLIWYSSASAFASGTSKTLGTGNFIYLYVAIAQLYGTYTPKLGDIPSSSLADPVLTVSKSSVTLTVVLVVLASLAVLGTGIVMVVRRRKK